MRPVVPKASKQTNKETNTIYKLCSNFDVEYIYGFVMLGGL